MITRSGAARTTLLWVLPGLLLLFCGCHLAGETPAIVGPAADGPSTWCHELCKTILPPYVIEPPDVLMIDAVRVVPRPPYRLQSADVILLQVRGTLPDAPLSGNFNVEPGRATEAGASLRRRASRA